eukprot:TRINITY_DN2565_c0_g1_i3.p1 TRINITY_DN2565_c0_g1~~TRINITY_DN2565_c0_g1_i3.p1  ORF type:complete len:107 (+),score=12.00 TRINITY_DN2565_c0_g1_i3:43-363(+)
MCIRDRYQRRVRGGLEVSGTTMPLRRSSLLFILLLVLLGLGGSYVAEAQPAYLGPLERMKKGLEEVKTELELLQNGGKGVEPKIEIKKVERASVPATRCVIKSCSG